jgi:bacterioferritin-associated ferredoxin
MAYVCLCNSVSERKVRKAIAHGAETVDEVGRTCGAGTTCFGCHDTIEELIDERSVGVARFAPAS